MASPSRWNILIICITYICSLRCEARNCAFIGWKKRMVCDDEVPEETPVKSRPKGVAGNGGGFGGGGASGAKKKGGGGNGGGGGGGARLHHHHHAQARTEPGFWPDPLALSKNNTVTTNEDSKVAFLFLSQGPLPLEPLWNDFFKKDLVNLYSIYIHPTPEFDCDDHFNSSSSFYGKCLPRFLILS